MQTQRARKPLLARMRRRARPLLISLLARTGLSRVVGLRYGGAGMILMFHEFVANTGPTLGQGCSISDFEAILSFFRRKGYQFVTLDAALQNLRQMPRGAAPFVAMTFDDGYRSNIELALPVMERFSAPATIFVPTGMIDRSLNAWWLGLRELALRHETIEIEPMGRRLLCSNATEKQAALELMAAWVWQDFRRVDDLASVFAAHRVHLADLVDDLAITEAEMLAADRHPLIEIGAHTSTHRALRLLEDTEVERDIGDNKAYLERTLQRPIDWFAYPYGPPSIGGTREAAIVKALGFKAAVSTDPGSLFEEQGDDPFLLPRLNAEVSSAPVDHIRCGVDGVFRALASRGGSRAYAPKIPT